MKSGKKSGRNMKGRELKRRAKKPQESNTNKKQRQMERGRGVTGGNVWKQCGQAKTEKDRDNSEGTRGTW